MSELIDSHCHLDFEVFDCDRAQLLARCQQLGIKHFIVPATSRRHWARLLTLCQQYPELHPALGMHPMFMAEHQAEDINTLDTMLNKQNVVAVGEIGLDFYDSKACQAEQISLFEQQLQLAQKHQLPVILHVRKAHDEVLKRLRQINLKGGIVHAFSGSQQQAEQYIELGFKLGVGGALTYSRARRLQKLFSQLPAYTIVLETDSPDMPLMGQQGQRNSPVNIPLILNKLAAIRPETIEQLAAISTDNCKQLFRLS